MPSAIVRVLSDHYVEALRKGLSPVGPAAGRLLYILAAALACREPLLIVEAGTGAGYSTAWLAAGLYDACSPGQVVSMDVSRSALLEAKHWLELEGLRSLVELVEA